MPTLFALSRLNDLWPVAVPCVLGSAAVFLLLPRPQGGRTALAGALLGGAALLAAAFLLVRTGVLSAETVLFYTFAGLAVVSGALLVTQQHPARAALSFALVVLCTCGLFLLLAAPFLMAATIIIYAGAIIVTFLFVLMLASQAGITDADARTREPLLATALGFLLLGCLIYVLQLSYEKDETVRTIDKLIAHAEKKRSRLSPESRDDFKAFMQTLKGELHKDVPDGARPARAAANELAVLDKYLDARLFDIDVDWPETQPVDVEKQKDLLTGLEAVFVRARQQHGWLLASASDKAAASNLSGPAGVVPNLDSDSAWRYDAEQRPHLPADNSAYLGRSLFTDFLLPVELGGVLLLVATIGAIAIAHRRSTPARAP